MPAVGLKDSSVIKLRPCKFVRETGDRFGIIRRAGMRRVVLRGVGLEACERFREGCSIRDVKRHLSNRFRIIEDRLDLEPLLRSLQNADLIASVDGARIREISPPSLYSAYRYYLRFHLKRKLLQFAYGKLPLELGRRLAYWVHRLDLSAILWPKALRAEEHARRSPDGYLQASEQDGFAPRYLRHLIQNIVDFESVQAMTPAQVEKWFDKRVRYEGLEHVAELKKEGLPVIIAGFHFSATKLLALLLVRKGHNISQLWMPDGSVNMAELTEKLEHLQDSSSEYGRLDIIPDFSLASYKRLLTSLRRGDLLVWFADMFSSNDRREEPSGEQARRVAAARIFEFGQIQTHLSQAKLDVTLCGQRVHLNPWIGGFARIAQAAVVPAALIREGSGFRMLLLPALRIPRNATQNQITNLNRSLFEQLDSLLRRYPDQWFGWHSLHRVTDSA
jgi:lauroyl/myristoyl acyltransferase